MIMKRIIKNTELHLITKNMKLYALFVVSIENLKNLKYYTSQKNHQLFLLLEVSARMRMQKMFQEENLIQILRIIGQIENI